MGRTKCIQANAAVEICGSADTQLDGELLLSCTFCVCFSGLTLNRPFAPHRFARPDDTPRHGLHVTGGPRQVRAGTLPIGLYFHSRFSIHTPISVRGDVIGTPRVAVPWVCWGLELSVKGFSASRR